MELEKLLNGPDGSVILTTGDSAVLPIPNADLGRSADLTLSTSADDFDKISGTTAEQRLAPTRTTATQAKITNARASERETKDAEKIAIFLQRIGKKVLEVMRIKFVRDIPAMNFNKQENFFEGVRQGNEQVSIDPLIDLGDETFDMMVYVQIDSLHPQANEQEKIKFIEFLTLLTRYPQVALSPILVRELAFRVGYKNERVIKEAQQVAQVQMFSSLQEMQQKGGGDNANNAAKQLESPTNDQVSNQLNAQLGV
jgi:hypothetical protein